MKAIVFERYGPPEMLSLREIEKPVVRPGEILVKVRAASVLPQDWHCLRGAPLLARLMAGGLLKPGHQVLGSDVAGRVEAVGSGVTTFEPGDDVFGFSFKHAVQSLDVAVLVSVTLPVEFEELLITLKLAQHTVRVKHNGHLPANIPPPFQLLVADRQLFD